MARTIDQIVLETLGAQQLMVCLMQAELEAAQAKIAELTPPPPKEPPDGR